MFQTVDVAAISFVPEKFGLEANCDRLEETFRKAAKGGAQLALAPEGVIEGYVVNEIIEGDEPAQRMKDVTITMRGAIMKRFKNLAKELGIALAFGCAEHIGRNVYNCAVFIDSTGRLCGKYHKMQLAEGSHSSWWFNRLGKNSRAFNTPFGRCGFLICNDRWNPDIARIPVLDGANYLLIPSFGSRSKAQDEAVLARARENGVPIVEANVGVTMIISKGEIVARSRRETGILYGTIEIPLPPSNTNRDKHERSFLKWRRTEMKARYEEKMERLKK
ncbi:MAG: carbon-nitrogen hydrolase family protein [Candidatus Latescibacteria bacterium]|jgi:predicted amidohydrolase|nr:carbon-nitrogen hydrolase family protein [Candidatus Latescibacterota bacterium]